LVDTLAFGFAISRNDICGVTLLALASAILEDFLGDLLGAVPSVDG
jgi:hypothetical protein